MGGELFQYALENKVASFFVLAGVAIAVFLAKLAITEWLARRRSPSETGGTQASDDSVAQTTTVGKVDSGGGNVEISPRIDKR